MASTTLSSIPRVFSVFPVMGMGPPPQRPFFPHAPASLVSLCLVVHNRRRVLCRDRGGTLSIFLDETTGVGPVRATVFDAPCLYRPHEMCKILCDALGLSIDKDSLYGLGSELLNCAVDTRSRNLCAVFEVVRNTVLVEGGGELDTCSICLDDLSGGSVIRTQCSHRFHASCLRPWLKTKNSCPLCRTEL